MRQCDLITRRPKSENYYIDSENTDHFYTATIQSSLVWFCHSDILEWNDSLSKRRIIKSLHRQWKHRPSLYSKNSIFFGVILSLEIFWSEMIHFLTMREESQNHFIDSENTGHFYRVINSIFFGVILSLRYFRVKEFTLEENKKSRGVIEWARKKNSLEAIGVIESH